LILIFASQATLDEIMCTPDIENGIGPVMIGTPIHGGHYEQIPDDDPENETGMKTIVVPDGRVAISHPFSEADCDWFSAYTQGDNPAVVICDRLPADFVPISTGE
jgi:hypothetical protein